jgi:general stress protein YciG
VLDRIGGLLAVRWHTYKEESGMSERRPRGAHGEAAPAVKSNTAASGEVAAARRKPGPRPGTEAARRGGTAAREKYGKEFYSRIGSKGGSTVRERRGSAFYTEIGRRGGEATKRNLGTEHYSRIGRIGGQRAHGRRGPANKAAQ